MPVWTPSPTPGDATPEPAQPRLNTMARIFLIVLLALGLSSALACGSSSSGGNVDANVNANSNTSPFLAPNPNISAETPAVNISPEHTPAPVNITTNSAAVYTTPEPVKTATPPNVNANAEQASKPGAKPASSPTPGLPSPEEIRRMLGNPVNIRTAPPPSGEQPMMKSRPKVSPTP